MEDQASQKRPATSSPWKDEHETPERRALKRSRLDSGASESTAPNFMPTSASKKFLLLHLQILRALYEDPLVDNKDEEQKKSSVEDGAMNDEMWEKIHKFLQERDQLRAKAKKVELLQGIHEEALLFMREEREIERSMPNPWVNGVPNMFNSHSIYTSTSQHSPQSRFRTSSHPEPNEGVDCFGLMAGLLRRKYEITDAQLKETTSPFLPLLTDIENRIEKLEKLLKEEQEHSVEKEETAASELATAYPFSISEIAPPSQRLNEESLARLETKLRLWNMLLLDLKTDE